MRAKLLLAAMLALPLFAAAQTVDQQKLDSFSKAVAHAEGFGVKHAIPTRYHNPGDLKTIPSAAKLPGQKAVGKGGHVVFKSDAAGWDALKDQIAKMVDGRSKHFNPNMTLTQVAKRYAGNWRPWVKIVSRELGVTPSTTLAEILSAPAPQAQATEDADLDPALFGVGFPFDSEFTPQN